MITRAIKNCLQAAKERGWEKTYWAVDIHGTMLKPNFKRDEISREFYPYAIEVMQALMLHKNIVKILYTCSYPHEIEQYLEYFAQHGIHFDYVNQNPEVGNGGYGYYEDKFYFNVLMDDKAGFDGETDWKAIQEILNP
jgi:hypothetical protein